jgi:hypothetical protein
MGRRRKERADDRRGIRILRLARTSGSSGIVLDDLIVQNPATIASGASVTNITPLFNGDAVYGNTAQRTLRNNATITATATHGDGVRLIGGGFVTNAGSGGLTGTLTLSGVIAATTRFITSGGDWSVSSNWSAGVPAGADKRALVEFLKTQ